jgi:hypothetical protein
LSRRWRAAVLFGPVVQGVEPVGIVDGRDGCSELSGVNITVDDDGARAAGVRMDCVADRETSIPGITGNETSSSPNRLGCPLTMPPLVLQLDRRGNAADGVPKVGHRLEHPGDVVLVLVEVGDVAGPVVSDPTGLLPR